MSQKEAEKFFSEKRKQTLDISFAEENAQENKIFKTSFSKYGTAYRDLIFPALQSQAKTHIQKEDLVHA